MAVSVFSASGHYSNASDYVRDLIRCDQLLQQERAVLIQALVAGENSGISSRPVEDVWQSVKDRCGDDVHTQ